MAAPSRMRRPAVEVGEETGWNVGAIHGRYRVLREAMPGMVKRDTSTPDLSIPDLSTPDLSIPDLSTPDTAIPDLSTSSSS